MRLERLVRGAPDRKHADIVLASGHGADRRPVRCNRHLHHRLRIAFELQTRFMQVEPVGLLGHRASLHQLHDDIERFVELAALILRVKTHLDRVIDERARPYTEHGAAARHRVELNHAAGERLWYGREPTTGPRRMWRVRSAAPAMNNSGQAMISNPPE